MVVFVFAASIHWTTLRYSAPRALLAAKDRRRIRWLLYRVGL